ncbi:MAG: tRNA lysidine(34) synthetase TilS [Bacteroidales bacterium]
MLVKHFDHNIKRLIPNYKQNKYLLAVSGGPDSVAMLHCAYRLNMQAVVAHCHFHLRGTEADADAKFSEKLAVALDYPFVIKHFNTQAVADERKISIQMAARELRYEWFESLRQKHACDYILIAHNRDDVAETVLINQIRGCGVRGMTGIAEKTGTIVRPLLHASRDDIVNWLSEHKLDWQQDSSNDKTNYMRNKIRHDILPEMEQIQPDIKSILHRNARQIQRSVTVFDQLLQSIKQAIFIRKNDCLHINIQHEQAGLNLLYELLRDYGFNYNQVQDLYQSKGSGKSVQSPDYTLIADRENWILRKNDIQTDSRDFLIHDKVFSVNHPLPLQSQLVNRDNCKINPDRHVAQFDADKLKFPLTLRRWKKGDKFIPLGMKGFQKLSDFFINHKLNLHQKEQQWLLCSGGDIIWVVGLQTDNRYKITAETKHVLEIRLY